MKNKTEYIIFIFFSRFFRLIGLNLSRKFSLFLAFFFFYILPIRKKVVLKNLEIAYPENNLLSIKKSAFSHAEPKRKHRSHQAL